MTSTSDYAEEIWGRREKEIRDLGSYEQIIAWMTQDSKGGVVRGQTKEIEKIAKALANPIKIIDDIKYADAKELDKIEKNLDVHEGMKREVEETIKDRRNYLNRYIEKPKEPEPVEELEEIEPEEEFEEEFEEEYVEPKPRPWVKLRDKELSETLEVRSQFAEMWKGSTGEDRANVERQLKELPFGSQVLGSLKRWNK